ncbi:MAG: hypothetical protein C4575_11885 [Desulforudis sp.]|nr:hypothetical protein [Clostridia bacterium]MDQ7791151.1 hypothetical protein [Clostridia bacterium]RJX17806.1 MAG: hypothetical protein C4575_11885 [Desulforudis sp.]
MAKKDDQVNPEIRGMERLEAVERIEEGDPETVLREAGAIGKNMIRKLVRAGEEALDELDLDNKEYKGKPREDI